MSAQLLRRPLTAASARVGLARRSLHNSTSSAASGVASPSASAASGRVSDFEADQPSVWKGTNTDGGTSRA